VGVFWPGCLRDFLPADDLPEDFLVILEELLPDVFVGLFWTAAEVAFRVFAELLAADFFFGAFLGCELLAVVVLLFDEVFFLELVAV
jgi:hypothetical protein